MPYAIHDVRVRHVLMVANPLAGMKNCTFVPPMDRVVVLAELPELYMTVTMLPSGFSKASASGLRPVVATRLTISAPICPVPEANAA